MYILMGASGRYARYKSLTPTGAKRPGRDQLIAFNRFAFEYLENCVCQPAIGVKRNLSKSKLQLGKSANPPLIPPVSAILSDFNERAIFPHFWH